jgi:hypothetical protein
MLVVLLVLTTCQARWVRKSMSCLPSASARSAVLRRRSDSPYGLSALIGTTSVSVA